MYKFLMYSGAQGMMLSHPFPVERVHFLREWAVSEEYQEIRRGNYQRSPASGAVNVTADSPENEAEALRRQVEELQQEINRMKKSE